MSDTLRFEFGANWRRFLEVVSEERIEIATRSIATALATERLDGCSFLDAGCGSGLSSMAARRLGAQVVSFDFDLQAVACTRELKRRFDGEGGEWIIEQGSILDATYLGGLGKFDIVYSWGVLHHTGEMWAGLDLLAQTVQPCGRLVIAIYNDQGWPSTVWRRIKRLYVTVPKILRPLILGVAFVRLWGPRMVIDAASGRPFQTWTNYRNDRGMSPWHDVVDWVGGYPFEFAAPDIVVRFLRDRGFVLDRVKTCGRGRGCNEFVFTAASSSNTASRTVTRS